jgi:hypothetical protein
MVRDRQGGRAAEMMPADRLGDITREAEEVAKILAAIVRTTRRPKAAHEESVRH